jgi:phosphonate transport system substrate-binding protein
MKSVFALSTLCCALVAVSAQAAETLGTRKNPIKFAFSPSADSQKLLASAEPLRQCLEKKTGLFFDISVPPSYIVVVEGLGSKKVDLAMLTASSYAKVLEKKYPVEPLVKVIRKGDSTYRGQIVVRADSGINKLDDLNGKKFAFVDPASGSGYLAPKRLLNAKGVKLGEETFANSKHDVVIMMVYQKQVDAGASFYSPPTDAANKRCETIDNKSCFGNDARKLVKTQFADVFDKIKVLSLTDELPNDPIGIRSELPTDTKGKVKEGLKGCFTELAAKGTKINDVDGAVDTSSIEYAPLIKLFQEMKVNLDEAMAPKKK